MFLSSCLETGVLVESKSPDKSLKLELHLENNALYYSLYKNNKLIIDKSMLGIKADKFDFSNSIYIVDISNHSSNTTWSQVWGEQKIIQDHYNQLS